MVDYMVTIMDGVVTKGLTYSSVTGMFLASTFVFIKFAYEYWRYSIGAIQGNDTLVIWDWQEVIRVIFICVLLSTFTKIVPSFTEAVRYINSTTAPSGDTHSAMASAANKWYMDHKSSYVNDKKKELYKMKSDAEKKGDSKRSKAADAAIERLNKKPDSFQDETPDGSTTNSMTNHTEEKPEGVSVVDMFSSDLLLNVLNEMTYWLAQAVGFVVGLFSIIVFKIAVVFGPLVLAFGILFRDKPMNYMNEVLVVAFVPTTLNLLSLIQTQFITDNMKDPSMVASISFNLVVIGSVLSAYKLTKLFIGQLGLSGVGGKGIAAGVAIGAAAASGGASAIAGVTAAASSIKKGRVD